MGSQSLILNRKADLVFPNLKPQSEIDCDSSPVVSRRGSKPLGPLPKRSIKLPFQAFPDVECKAVVLSVRNIHEYGDLYPRYLRARRDVFIVQKGWQLPETDGMEFDQYDTPLARWIALERNGEILGGARISPTTAICGSHSYMIRDAQLGHLPSIPKDLLFELAPVQPEIWEATRLFITDAVPSSQRPDIQNCLMRELASAAKGVGATHIIGIVPAIFCRWLKRIGMNAHAVGPTMLIDGEKVQAALMNVGSSGTD
jgi:acyl homoserine lactone synthase